MKIEVFENFLHDEDPVQFPCFEMDITAIAPLSTSNMSWQNPQEGQYSGDNVNFVFLNPSNPAANFSALFPDWGNMPHLSTAAGSIIRSECKYELDSGITYSVQDSGITAVPLGVKPDDWESNWMYYGTIYTTPAASDTGYYFKIFTPLSGVDTTTTTVPNPSSIWDENTQYYKNDPTDHDYRLSRLFSTYNKGSFGVSTLQGGFDPAWPTKSPRAGGIAPRSGEYTYAFRNYPFWSMHGYAGDYSNFNAHYYLSVPIPYTATNAAGYIYGFNWGNDTISTPMLEYRNQMFIFVHFVYNDEVFYGIALLNMSDNTENAYPVGVRVMAFSENFWGDSIVPDSPERPENFGDVSTWAGGNGTFSDDSDNRGDRTGTAIASMVSNTVTTLKNTGVFNNASAPSFNVFKVTDSSALPNLLALLYDTGGNSYMEKYREVLFNPVSAIVSLHLMPASLLPLQGETRDVSAGGYNFSDIALSNPVPKLPTIDMLYHRHIGSFDFAHYFDGFADFAPYTQIFLHLPYCGTIKIDTNAVMYGWISIDYVVDILNGNVGAFVTCCDKNGRTEILYNVTGNCAYSIPLFAENQNGGAMGKIMSNAIGSMLSGNPFSALSQFTQLTDYALTGTFQRHTEIAGSISGNPAMVSDTMCYLEIIRPEWINPETFADLSAMPAEIGGTIAELAPIGKTVVSRIELDNIDCTDDEKQEISRILSAGIFIMPESPERSESGGEL